MNSMKILLAVDGTEPSKAAFSAVKNTPWSPGSTVRVLSVTRDISPLFAPSRFEPVWAVGAAGAVHPATTQDLEQPGQPHVELQQRLMLEAESVVRRVAELLRGTPELSVETVVRSGDAREVIVDEATQWHADLIVVGSHSRNRVQRWLLGSVAEAVVRNAPCSVQVARPGPEATS